MRIFDINDIEIDIPDLTKGRLEPDRRFMQHHNAIEAVEEQGHYETIAVYPNGGEDVEWVVDVPGVEAKDAWDEYEDIYRYIPFTTRELCEIRIVELKMKLSETDYHIIKVVEGAMPIEACADIIAQRAEWRREINDLEETLRAEGGESDVT